MQYTTTHELAMQLLSGADKMVVLSVPVFDMPGCSHAMPVAMREQEIEGKPCVVLMPAPKAE